jgi:hypothetical protein
MEILEPETWGQINDVLWRASYSATYNKWTSNIAFRGVARDHGNLKTSLQRLPFSNLEWRERRLLDSYNKHARPEFIWGKTDWDLMLLGQHHGLPTRLLDWTLSPLVALFFVVNHDAHYDKDGVIWCVNRVEIHRLLNQQLQDLLYDQSGNMFTPETLARQYPTLQEFDKLPSETMIFSEPPGIDPRIINQYSIFSVMPNPMNDTLSFLERHKDFCWKVRIPKKLKPEIRQRLMVMNVSERTMYPGLDGIGSWLKAWYSQP